MGQGRNRHNTSRSAPLQRRQQQPGQSKGPEMVSAELPFVTIDGQFPIRKTHHAGVVDQNVEDLAAAKEVLRKRTYRSQRGQIEFGQLSSDAGRLLK